MLKFLTLTNKFPEIKHIVDYWAKTFESIVQSTYNFGHKKNTKVVKDTNDISKTSKSEHVQTSVTSDLNENSSNFDTSVGINGSDSSKQEAFKKDNHMQISPTLTEKLSSMTQSTTSNHLDLQFETSVESNELVKNVTKTKDDSVKVIDKPKRKSIPKEYSVISNDPIPEIINDSKESLVSSIPKDNQPDLFVVKNPIEQDPVQKDENIKPSPISVDSEININVNSELASSHIPLDEVEIVQTLNEKIEISVNIPENEVNPSIKASDLIIALTSKEDVPSAIIKTDSLIVKNPVINQKHEAISLILETLNDFNLTINEVEIYKNDAKSRKTAKNKDVIKDILLTMVDEKISFNDFKNI